MTTADMESSLKEQKEAFVTGHHGTTPQELLLVCLSAPVGIWLFQLVKTEQTSLDIIWEALVLLFPMALCQTNLLYPWGVELLCFEVLLALVLSIRKKRKSSRKVSKIPSSSSRLDFVTCYRSCVSYLTFVAILAVDFHVFPRRFAKTEVYGYGLMDLGAASFVVAAGLTSPRARGSGTKKRNQFRIWKIIPLLLLGMIRLLTNKGLEYQEHVSEYGVHWNFFFTLAALAPLGTLIPLYQGIPVIILIGYQFLLSEHGLQEYVENAPRVCEQTNVLCDLFAANREGILGCIGYLALYLLGEIIGRDCLWANGVRGGRLFLVVFFLWFVHWIITDILDVQVSRRTTNSAFVVWALAHNCSILVSLWCATRFGNTVPPIFQAVNRNGLLVFVVANLLTGAVNLSINTLEASDPMALVVVFAYLCAVGVVALLADKLLKKTDSKKVD